MTTLQELFNAWKSLYGPVPDSYVSLDLETTGFSPNKHVIVQIGWCFVSKGEVGERGSDLLDWRGVIPMAGMGKFREDLDKQEARCAHEGYKYSCTWDDLCSKGQPALEVLQCWMSKLSEWAREKRTVLMYHGVKFDLPFLRREFEQFLHASLPPFPAPLLDTLPPNIIDAAVFVKGAQLPGLLPRMNESSLDFTVRAINASAPHLQWNLHKYAMHEYKLHEAGDVSQVHDADQDAYLTHVLLEELRRLAVG
jgi:DNA polymerase III epsilon subunit-like protein